MQIKTKIIGITGSIAMGKSYIASLFKDNNIPVFDADYEIKKIYMIKNIADEIIKYFPEAISGKEIDTKILANLVFVNSTRLNDLQNILYPLFNINLENFINDNQDKEIIILDIPLLFERKYDQFCDYIINVYCSKYIQTIRALKRPSMSLEKLSSIRKIQLSSLRKKLFADFNIYTGYSFNSTCKQFDKIYRKIKCVK